MKLKKENSMKINNKKLENAIVELTVAFDSEEWKATQEKALDKLAKKVFAQLWRDYKDYFKIPSYRDTLKAKYHEAEEYLNTWYPSNNLKMEIEEANRFDY